MVFFRNPSSFRQLCEEQNSRYWTVQNPDTVFFHNAFHSNRFSVRCTVSNTVIYRSVFLEGTFNYQACLKVSKKDFLPFLMDYGADIDKALFQEDLARPHTACNLLNFFEGSIWKQLLCWWRF